MCAELLLPVHKSGSELRARLCRLRAVHSANHHNTGAHHGDDAGTHHCQFWLLFVLER
jgi:hypothetical protein